MKRIFKRISNNSVLSGALKVLLAAGILFWLVQKGFFDIRALLSVCTPINILLFLGLGLINSFFISERSRILIAKQVAQYSAFQVFKLTLLGLFFNFAMPGGVGGDVIKGVYLVKNNLQQKGRSLLALLLDRVIGLYCMIFLAVLVMTLDFDHVIQHEKLRPIFLTMLTVWIGISIGAVLCLNKIFNPKLHTLLDMLPLPLKPKLHQLIDALKDFGQQPSFLLKACLYSLLSQFFAIVIFFLVAKALNFESVGLSICLMAAPVGFIVTALPITPGGVGLGQAVFFYIFEAYTPGTGVVGTTAITVLQAVQFTLGLWGAFYFIRSDRHLVWSQVDDV